MTGDPLLAQFRDASGNLVFAELRNTVLVGVYVIGQPGFVQYHVRAEGAEPPTREEQVKILREAANWLEER